MQSKPLIQWIPLRPEPPSWKLELPSCQVGDFNDGPSPLTGLDHWASKLSGWCLVRLSSKVSFNDRSITNDSASFPDQGGQTHNLTVREMLQRNIHPGVFLFNDVTVVHRRWRRAGWSRRASTERTSSWSGRPSGSSTLRTSTSSARPMPGPPTPKYNFHFYLTPLSRFSSHFCRLLIHFPSQV